MVSLDLKKVELFMENSFTPMMKQYNEAKAEVPGKILFFRMGDFYELFGQDALTAAPILGIALTSRDKKNPLPMCGIPYHAVTSYISKLTNSGHSVAICEQVEDPKKAKGIVKREIVRVVTPSLVYDSDVIDGKQSSYLASLVYDNGNWSYAYIDYSTGEFRSNSVPNTDSLVKELSLVSPKEIVYEKGTSIPEVLKRFLFNVCFSAVEHRTSFSSAQLSKMIVDSRLSSSEIKAGGLILNYLIDTQFRDSFPHIRYFSKVSSSEYLGIDEFTSKNLDLFGSFLKCVDDTITPMGGRALRKSIAQPLMDKTSLDLRLDAVERLTKNYGFMEKTRLLLSQCSDIDRLSSKVALGQYNPRDIRKLFESIETASIIYDDVKLQDDLNLPVVDKTAVYEFAKNMTECMNEEQPHTVKDGGIFKKGFKAELDELIDLHTNSRQVLMDMEKRERENTKISSLKIKYNKVFGYYIEITNSNLHLVPENYQRKQTLVNGERFMTPELRELEIKLLSAEEDRVGLEERLLEEKAAEFRERYLNSALELSSWIADLDLAVCFAWIAVKRKYVRPELHDGFELVLKDARHPVLYETMKEEFVPNDIDLSSDGFFHIITGPNMAGKSTIMRTVALLVIMSHMGSFIPVSSAKVPITDRVFTRVGATDYILQGQSTFMVEMIETANIIFSASKRSLIILDEIGRGTSTYDGISIAWAVAEHIHNSMGSKCMFATHYHELTALETELSGARNFSMSVEEEKGSLFFLRKIVPRPASRSYGIQVAAMAGLPNSIITRARSVMKRLEEERAGSAELTRGDLNQLSLFDKKNNSSENKKDDYQFINELASIDLDKLTPLEALGRLYRWKDEVKKIEQSDV